MGHRFESCPGCHFCAQTALPRITPHQQSGSNTKPSYTMGHSCQAVCVLARGLASVVAVPLAARIHEGLVLSNQHLHRKDRAYRDAVRRKVAAYHRFMQLGLIAQGMMQVLATTVPKLVWGSFGSWLRTVRPGICPSELVVATAMRNSLPEFLADSLCAPCLTKFIRDRLDLERAQGTRLAA